jgi:hypothetical protein
VQTVQVEEHHTLPAINNNEEKGVRRWHLTAQTAPYHCCAAHIRLDVLAGCSLNSSTLTKKRAGFEKKRRQKQRRGYA